ncbi:MAG: hypothetical protein J6V24_07410 [Clostridia bacterium]|nr:hypothetical protein [Clostridia bacterium]
MSDSTVTFAPSICVFSTAGAIAFTAIPSGERRKTERANFGQPWLKFAVQQP